jgi:hypothetical protein
VPTSRDIFFETHVRAAGAAPAQHYGARAYGAAFFYPAAEEHASKELCNTRLRVSCFPHGPAALQVV